MPTRWKWAWWTRYGCSTPPSFWGRRRCRSWPEAVPSRLCATTVCTASAPILPWKDTCAMFTGIIEEVGTVAELTTPQLGAGRLRIECSKLLPRFDVSSSVAVSGCCLTVTRRDDTGFWCDLAPETLNRTGFPPPQSAAPG